MNNNRIDKILNDLQLYEEVKNTLFYAVLNELSMKIGIPQKKDILNSYEIFKKYKNKVDLFIIEEYIQSSLLGVSEENMEFMSNLSLNLKDVRFCKWYFLGIPADVIKNNYIEVQQHTLFKIYNNLKDKKNIKKEISTLTEDLDIDI